MRKSCHAGALALVAFALAAGIALLALSSADTQPGELEFNPFEQIQAAMNQINNQLEGFNAEFPHFGFPNIQPFVNGTNSTETQFQSEFTTSFSSVCHGANCTTKTTGMRESCENGKCKVYKLIPAPMSAKLAHLKNKAAAKIIKKQQGG
mmetsp:Transcript_35185/g.80265  ORF Transcript_35185/g.80265 Transcript_35185/m.80265 type:complete len:150 (-) Transcript_35185:156-605(-)